MSKNEITMYLRPISYIQPYQIISCAKWLVRIGKFANYKLAMYYLSKLSGDRFKAVMSRYFKENDYSQDHYYTTNTPAKLDTYRSSANNYYGEEYHMW